MSAAAIVDGEKTISRAELEALIALEDSEAKLVGRGRFVARRLGSDLGAVVAVARALRGEKPLLALHPRLSEDEIARRLALFEEERALEAYDLVAPEDAAMVVFTSGSSGAGAPIVLTRSAFEAAAMASAKALDFGEGDRYLLSMPLAHVGGASIVARALTLNAVIVLDRSGPRFEARAFVEALTNQAVTHASVVSTMLRRIVDAGLSSPPYLRRLVVGGAACDDALALEARALGFPVVRTYGMTETCAMSTCEAFPGEGGVGRAFDSVVLRAIDGELRVSSPARASLIFPDRPLPTDEEGLLRTKDAGEIRDGIVHVHGRLDDVIITGGENVHPAEVEAALLSCPGVEAAVVFGAPDPEWGAAVIAAIVCAEELSLDALEAMLRERVASYARPKRLIRFETFPLLGSGKVDRRAVVAATKA